MKRNLKYAAIGGILIVAGVIQAVSIFYSRSELIWEDYCYFESSGNDYVILPHTFNHYLFVLDAYHGVMGSDITWLDVTFSNVKSGHDYHYSLTADSTLSPYAEWYDDSVKMNIPSGNYSISWTCTGAWTNYNLFIYNESFLNNGDPSFNNEKFAVTFSMIGLYLMIFFGIMIIIFGNWEVINSKLKA